MNLLLLEPGDVDDHGIATLAGARAAHVHAVLGARPGQLLRVGLVDGPFGSGEVIEADPALASLRCTFDLDTPPRPVVDLLLALPRPKVLRRLWGQLAAIGVGRIILTNASRVERNYFDTHVLQPAVYRPLLIEGLQQARDTRVPEVSVHRQFRVLIEDHLDRLMGSARRLVADPLGSVRIADALAVAGTAAERVLLAVGPEGGWTRFELDLLAGCGFTSVTVGRRTLRSDTACIALLSLIHDASQALTPHQIR